MMENSMMKRRLLLGLAAGALAAPGLARAQGAAWPARGPIRLVAQFPTGGAVDTVSRAIAPSLAAALGQEVVVENRPGVGGVAGTDFVAKAPADGYTLLVSHASVHVMSAATVPALPFDPVADFTHIGMLVDLPGMLLVPANSRFRTLADLVTAARTEPVLYGSSGVGSGPHLLGALLASEGRADFLDHVPYRGSAPAIQDMLAGEIQAVMDPVTSNVQALRAGTIRALAVSTPQRLREMPDVPTFAEQGFPNLSSSQWLGLSGPKGLPPAVVERLTALLPQLLDAPEFRARAEAMASPPRMPPLLGDAFTRLMREQITHWTAVARQFNIVVS